MPLQVSVVTAEREVWSGEASFVVARSAGGEIGVLPGHSPFLGALRYSTVKIEHEDGEMLIAVHGGFIEVFEDHVAVLARAAERAEEIDLERARAAKERAEEALRAEGGEEAEQDLLRAEARMRTATAMGGLGAGGS